MKNFACRYPLYFRRKNVEAASTAGIFREILGYRRIRNAFLAL